MIARNRITLTTHDDSLSSIERIQLAPFTADEYRQYVPYPEEYNRHNPVVEGEDSLTAEELIEQYDQMKRTLTWGIYVEGRETSNNTAANFVGTMAISEHNAGTKDEPHWSKVVQTVHTSIYSARWHGLGIGTLSKLAVASYAFDKHKTHALQANTSENNIAAHRSLEKTGFSRLDTYKYYEFPDGSMTAYWMMVDPELQPSVSNLQEREMHAEGWKRHMAARKKVSVSYEE